jgi:2-hydroxy-3-keto-5-methylthiopentenyl-1-phosphate phosphatase
MFTVQCDFDDTIVTGNVAKSLLNAFASAKWRDIENLYSIGEITVEESNRREFALLNVTRQTIEDHVFETVELRPGFPEFLEHCTNIGINFSVVSNGVDLYIEPALRSLFSSTAQLHSAHGKIIENGISISYLDPYGIDCQDAFKLSWLRYYKSQGQEVIYIGDGESDISAALEADYVIATSSLEDYFRSEGLNYFEFKDFYDVRQAIDRILI